MDRETDGFPLVGEGSPDRLLDPPAGVGAELHAPAGFESFHRLHEAKISFRNKIHEGKTAVVVIGCDFDHEAEVGFDHQLPGLTFAATNTTGHTGFLLPVEKGGFPDAFQVGLKGGRKFRGLGGKLFPLGGFSFCIHTRLDRGGGGTFGLFFEKIPQRENLA